VLHEGDRVVRGRTMNRGSTTVGEGNHARVREAQVNQVEGV